LEDAVRDQKDLMFVHSACCEDHWELIFNKKTKEWSLVCCGCGKGIGIKVTGPDVSDLKCKHCEKEEKNERRKN
jgi:hypothetical protein